jgi:putative hemolysin
MVACGVLVPLASLSLAGHAWAQRAGLPNPAAVFCVRHGGKLIPRSDERGNEYALCALPDGRVIEEWRLFRCSHPPSAAQEQPRCQGESVAPGHEAP